VCLLDVVGFLKRRNHSADASYKLPSFLAGKAVITRHTVKGPQDVFSSSLKAYLILLIYHMEVKAPT